MTALGPDQVPGLAFVEISVEDLRSRQLIAEVQARALYESHGYRPIPGFGHYQNAPLSRGFRREL